MGWQRFEGGRDLYKGNLEIRARFRDDESQDWTEGVLISYSGLGANRAFIGKTDGRITGYKLCENWEEESSIEPVEFGSIEEDEISEDAVYVGPHSDLDGYANAASNLARLINAETGRYLFADSMALEAVAMLHVAACKLRTAALFRAREVAGNL